MHNTQPKFILDVEDRSVQSCSLDDETVKAADCVLIVTDHSHINYARVVVLAAAVIDTRNATSNVLQHREKITKL
jgi:UDP-N-acetyl-D-glucosamine dehydrogenase